MLTLFMEVTMCGWMELGKLRALDSCPLLPSTVYEIVDLSQCCNVSELQAPRMTLLWL